MGDGRDYRFGPFTLAPARRELRDADGPVTLGGRALDLLVALVEGRDRVVLKDELMRRVWPDTVVEENNLTVNVSALRKALREGAGARRYIRTVPGRGYRFVAEVSEGEIAAAPRAPAAPAVEAPSVPDMPSIAVLAFTNMSGSVEHEYFADGISEDIITQLARNRWLFVIARNSTFTYKGRAVDVREVARELGVRYVLEGSVRVGGNRVRVTGQLIDAASASHLWADRYDRDMTDIFAVQDEITERITLSIQPALVEAEQGRAIRHPPERLDAWQAYQRGVWHFSRHRPAEAARAAEFFRRAIAMDPLFAPGHYGLAHVLIHEGSTNDAGHLAERQAEGERIARHAVTLDPSDPTAHTTLAAALMLRGALEAALASTATALRLNPSDATAHGTAGAVLVFAGRRKEGKQALERAMRLSPRDPRLHIRLSHIGGAQFIDRDYDLAEATALRLIRDWPEYGFGYRLLAMVLAETGRRAEAEAALREAVRLAPGMFAAYGRARMPWISPEDHARVTAALRRAGWTGADAAG
jgi:adenylate cyclase